MRPIEHTCLEAWPDKRVRYKDLKELALQTSTDPDHRFDLAIQLDDLDAALSMAKETPAPENEAKWKAVGDRALAVWRFELAQECYEKASDSSALLLLHLATGNREGLAALAKLAGVCLFTSCIISC